jgi:hypothetical protein
MCGKLSESLPKTESLCSTLVEGQLRTPPKRVSVFVTKTTNGLANEYMAVKCQTLGAFFLRKVSIILSLGGWAHWHNDTVCQCLRLGCQQTVLLPQYWQCAAAELIIRGASGVRKCP